MDHELVTLHFANVEVAEATMDTIRSLQAEGFIELDDAAIVTRSASGGVTVTPVGLQGMPKKAAFGAIIGLVAGSLVGLPVLGAMAGSGITGTKAVREAVNRLDAVLDAVAEHVGTGSAVLALAVRSLPDPDIVVDRLSIHRDAMTRVEIPAQLREQIEKSRSDQS